jgi:hypothetical protein
MDVKLYLQCTLNKSPTKKTHPETGCRQEARQICAPSNCELVKSDKVDSSSQIAWLFVSEGLCSREFFVSEGSSFQRVLFSDGSFLRGLFVSEGFLLKVFQT